MARSAAISHKALILLVAVTASCTVREPVRQALTVDVQVDGWVVGEDELQPSGRVTLTMDGGEAEKLKEDVLRTESDYTGITLRGAEELYLIGTFNLYGRQRIKGMLPERSRPILGKAVQHWVHELAKQKFDAIDVTAWTIDPESGYRSDQSKFAGFLKDLARVPPSLFDYGPDRDVYIVYLLRPGKKLVQFGFVVRKDADLSPTAVGPVLSRTLAASRKAALAHRAKRAKQRHRFGLVGKKPEPQAVQGPQRPSEP